MDGTGELEQDVSPQRPPLMILLHFLKWQQLLGMRGSLTTGWQSPPFPLLKRISLFFTMFISHRLGTGCVSHVLSLAFLNVHVCTLWHCFTNCKISKAFPAIWVTLLYLNCNFCSPYLDINRSMMCIRTIWYDSEWYNAVCVLSDDQLQLAH